MIIVNYKDHLLTRRLSPDAAREPARRAEAAFLAPFAPRQPAVRRAPRSLRAHPLPRGWAEDGLRPLDLAATLPQWGADRSCTPRLAERPPRPATSSL